jgi:hypothetical protein
VIAMFRLRADNGKPEVDRRASSRRRSELKLLDVKGDSRMARDHLAGDNAGWRDACSGTTEYPRSGQGTYTICCIERRARACLNVSTQYRHETRPPFVRASHGRVSSLE